MKRAICVFLLFALVIPFVYAQNAPGLEDAPIASDIIKGAEKIRNSSSENSSSYLETEWRKTLDKTESGKLLLKVSDFVKIFNPLFKIILGYEYSLSWGFFFAVAIWFTLFMLLVNPLSVMFDNRLFGIIAGFLITSIVGLTGVIKKAVELLAMIIETWWIALIILVAIIAIAILMERLGIGMGAYLKKQRDLSKQVQTEQDRQIIHADANAAQQDLDIRGG